MKGSTAKWSVLGIVTALTVTACAQGSGGGGADATFDKDAEIGAGEVSIMGFSSGDEIASTRFDLAKAAVAPATVKNSEGELDMQAFLSANAAGNAPDIVYLKRDQIGDLANLGAIMPLTQCVAGEEIAIDDFEQAALGQVTFDDTVYGIPEFNQVQLTMANTDLLAAAGLTTDDVNGSDWSRIEAAATAMNVVDGTTLQTIGYDPKIPEFFPLWVKSAGGDLISEDGRTAQIDTPESLAALELGVGILENEGGWGKVKALRDSADFFGKGNQFATGELGAMNMEQWYVNVLNDVTPEIPLAVVPFVSQETGDPISMATGSAWAVPSKSGNPEAACRFIKVMTETDSWYAAAKARFDARTAEGKPFTGLLTGNDVADDRIREDFVKPSGDAKWDAAVEATYEANDHLFYSPANPADVAFKKAWQGAVNRAIGGEQEPAAALAQAQKEAQEALDAAWAKREG
ncbi:extracellular solute-binding protein [Oerskovia jenensis]|uniref:extracellular solute-binding protein n=1 Tax=Oerskovia jenensis TaxID=162169 RepID=UPI0036DF56DF